MLKKGRQKEESQIWERCPKCGGDLIKAGSNQYVSRWKCIGECGSTWVLPKVRK